MGICSGCAKPLRGSIKIIQAGQVYKSCPECSGKVGYHVFYRLEDFGDRDMGDGRIIPQSWCPACRSDLLPLASPALTCI